MLVYRKGRHFYYPSIFFWGISMSRLDRDSLGEMELPDDLPYGIQTARAVTNFSISGQTVGEIPGFIAAIVEIKKAAAIANGRINGLAPGMVKAIVRAADATLANYSAKEFPVDVYHGGGGTAANMNVNEVLARRASGEGLDVHPNTHVNMGQSTNDVVPAAMKITVYRLLLGLEAATRDLTRALARKEKDFASVVKLARTCLQDALPITLGQQFSGYRAAVERQADELARVRNACLHLPLGATAVGTEFGAFPGYKSAVYEELLRVTGIAFVPEDNFFDGLQNADIWMAVSAVLKALAMTLSKIAADLRLMSSGPRGGLSEVELPAVQPGSSIMPGKVNPVIPEMVMQVHFRVLGNDLSISRACEGELDLNVWESLILHCVAESAVLLREVMPLFSALCIDGIKAHEARCRFDARMSLALSTTVATLFDYEMASAIAKEAARDECSVEEVVVRRGLLSPHEAARLLDPFVLTQPALFGALFSGKR
jgi:aspartate ammonia-lyase